MPGLINRMTTALSASIHDALDSAESPDSVLRQLIRESSESLSHARKLTIDAVASEKRLGKEIEQHNASVTEWTEAAKASMTHNDEDGARHALEMKIDHQRLLEQLTPQHERAVSNSAALKLRLKELEQSLANLKSKKSAIVARQKGAEAIRHVEEAANDVLSKSQIDDQILRAEELVADLETRNEAISEVDNATRPETFIEAQLIVDQVEREMQALRAAR